MIQVKKQLMDGKYIFRHVNVNKETIKSLLTQFVKGTDDEDSNTDEPTTTPTTPTTDEDERGGVKGE